MQPQLDLSKFQAKGVANLLARPPHRPADLSPTSTARTGRLKDYEARGGYQALSKILDRRRRRASP